MKAADEEWKPVEVPIMNELFMDFKIVQITTGRAYSLFLASTGHVYACGNMWCENPLCENVQLVLG